MSLVAPQVIVGGYPNAGALGGFSPADIAGLQLWLDASDTSTITASSGAVSQWDDKSGNDRHVSQGTAAKQPATGTHTINGVNSIQFDGVDDILKAAAFTLNQPESVFIVITEDALINQRVMYDGDAANSMIFMRRDAEGGLVLYAGSYGPALAQSTGAAVFLAEFNGASSTLARNNGTPATGDAGTSNAGGFTLGAQGGDVTHQNFQVGAVLLYSRILTASEKLDNWTYLANKWGITL